MDRDRGYQHTLTSAAPGVSELQAAMARQQLMMGEEAKPQAGGPSLTVAPNKSSYMNVAKTMQKTHSPFGSGLGSLPAPEG